jgi:hypothetical protein
MNVVPASECWNMTVNSVIDRIISSNTASNSVSANLMQTQPENKHLIEKGLSYLQTNTPTDYANLS